eukprot:TRINITY_DN1490_c0_g2_i1.p1 TRINITY_DN1490_c0_g2~~TRINITY_DN1490_c0_g2_i1.p1  ORF type:complete len:297 (+),score=109.54 TRINITY_DN1490_c0_g2_i1:219-1109(+)
MASVDLLPQLRESTGAIQSDHVALDLPAEAAEGEVSEMDAYYEVILKVNEQLQSMKTHSAELNQVHNQLHCATSDASKKKLREDAAALHDKFSSASQSVKSNLDGMEEAIKRCKSRAEKHPAELRIQENQFMLKRQEFVSALTAFQEIEQSNKAKYRDTIARRIKTKFSDQQLGDEQVEKMADEVIANGKESAIFSSNKMSIAATTLEEVVEMRRDIQKIESALKALHQMFLDMAVLVHEQGELINDIRDNVGKASQYVYQGTVQVKQAQEYQKRSRRYVPPLVLNRMRRAFGDSL